MQGVAQDAWLLRLGKNVLSIIQGTVDADEDAEDIGHALAVITQAFLPVSVGQGFKLPEPGGNCPHYPESKMFLHDPDGESNRCPGRSFSWYQKPED